MTNYSLMTLVNIVQNANTICSKLCSRFLSNGSLWRPKEANGIVSNAFSAGKRQFSCQKVTPSRSEQIQRLKSQDFDILVIGGGAAGCGCALDASSRGLEVALIEANDFASGASSKSSKLIDAGALHLKQAITGFDLDQLHMLRKALHERSIMLRIAPHLNRPLPMLVPIYKALDVPFYWLCFKLYDLISGVAGIKDSHTLTREATMAEFPLLRSEDLRGSIIYYDSVHDDARMCIALATTAVQNCACVANYMELLELIKHGGCCRCAGVRDCLTGEKFFINAKCVINTTGACTDTVRVMDDARAAIIGAPRCGTYVALPNYFGSTRIGLIRPADCADEPPLLILPWENRLIMGLVEEGSQPCELNTQPRPERDVTECLLEQARSYFECDVELCAAHVRSAWTGIRPTVNCPLSIKEDPCNPEPVRNFLVEVSDCNLITLVGGRWNIYRLMAEEAVDTAIDYCCLKPEFENSCTQELQLDGAHGYNCMLPLELVQCYELPMDVAEHLADAYGTNAHIVLAGSTAESRQRLHCHFPYIEAEVCYVCKHEYACHVVDVIARRLRVAFVDAMAALEMVPRILDIMTQIHSWDEGAVEFEMDLAQRFLCRQMGLGSIVKLALRPGATSEPPPAGNAGQRVEARNYSQQASSEQASDVAGNDSVLKATNALLPQWCSNQQSTAMAIVAQVELVKHQPPQKLEKSRPSAVRTQPPGAGFDSSDM